VSDAPPPTLRGAGWRMPAARPGARRIAPHRLILIEMAIAVLLVFAVSGILYLELWRGAAQDLTRILPATTLTWATSPPPRLAVDQVASLDRWRDGSAVTEGRAGYLDSAVDSEVFGLPIEQIRQLYRSADSVSFAVVPTGDGPAPMVFAEVRDLLARKRVTARLAPFLEPVDRHVGFRIDAAHRSPWLRFAGVERGALRVVSMDPYLVFSWGPPEGLEELLDARVGGESQSLQTRAGFWPRRSNADDGGALRAYLDPGALWALVAGDDEREEDARRLIDDLELVTATSRLTDDDEVVDLRALVRDQEDAERLELSLVNRRHELIDLAPSDAPWVVSLITERPLATLSAVRELVLRLGQDLGAAGDELRGLADGLSSIEIEAIVRLDWEVAAAFAGEVAYIRLPPAPGRDAAEGDAPEDDWAIIARLARPRVVEQTLDRLLPFILGDAWAYGEVVEDGGRLHVVRAADAGEEGAVATPEALAWRVDGPLLELAPRVEHLERLRLFRQSGQTYGDTGLARRALEALPDESAAVVVARPDAVAGPDTPLLTTIASRLSPDFRVAVTLRAEVPWLRATSNVGPWSVAAAVASASRDEVNAFTLRDLDPRCREAQMAMCRLYPDAVPCQPLSLGRGERIRRACEALFPK